MLNDRKDCNVVDVGLLIMKTVYRLYPKISPWTNRRICCSTLQRSPRSKEDKPLDDIRATWRMDLVDFQQRRERYLIYK